MLYAAAIKFGAQVSKNCLFFKVFGGGGGGGLQFEWVWYLGQYV